MNNNILMKPSSDPPVKDNPLIIDEEDDDFDIVMHNSTEKEAYNPFAPKKDESQEIVMIGTHDVNVPSFVGEPKKPFDEKDPIDSDSITDNEASDSLATFISTLDNY